MATIENFVIIGASHAGVQLAVSLRENKYEGNVVLISNEVHVPYHRPPLSKAYLKDDQLSVQALRGEDYYEANGIEIRNSQNVAGVDLNDKLVILESGESLPFSQMCFATGARPRPLDIPGINAKGVYQLRDADDAGFLRKASRKQRKVVVVGGGFIGLEAAATLCGLGMEVVVVEAAPRLMGRAVAPEISAYVLQRLTDLGIDVQLDTPVSAIETDGGKVCAVQCGDKRFEADMALIGIGVVPNDELATDAGITTGNGIHVDSYMGTSADNVYAIGDVAAQEHWLVGSRIRIESVQNATDQAKALAATITGNGEPYKAVPWFWSDQADMKLQMVGLSHNSKSRVKRENPERGAVSVFHYDEDDKLIAIDTINAPADHMAGRKIIAKGVSPTKEQAGDVGFSLRGLM